MKKREVEELFREHFRRACLQSEKIVGSREVAQDIVQDIFEKLLKKEVTSSVSSTSLLYTMVRNSSIDHLRRQQRFTHTDDSELLLIDNTPNPENISDDTVEKLYNAINTLPTRAQSVVKLVCLENSSYKEASKKLNMSDNTVKTHMYRSMTKLRKILTKT